MKKIAILQPSYIPWLGFFEQLYRSDVFVFLDDVQYTKNDWRNRNRIKTKDGVQWLTIPVVHKFGQLIRDTRIVDTAPWSRKHLQSITVSYGRSRYFADSADTLNSLYSKKWKFLLDISLESIQWMRKYLGIQTEVMLSSELGITCADKQRRLIEICRRLHGNSLYEGSSGKGYMDSGIFTESGISVEFQNYVHPYYDQLWMKEQGFISHLSALDLLLNHGPLSLQILIGQQVIDKPKAVTVRSAADVSHET